MNYSTFERLKNTIIYLVSSNAINSDGMLNFQFTPWFANFCVKKNHIAYFNENEKSIIRDFFNHALDQYNQPIVLETANRYYFSTTNLHELLDKLTYAYNTIYGSEWNLTSIS